MPTRLFDGMKYFIIAQDFDLELSKSFISFVNENDGPITIYLDSNGGEWPTAQVIREIVNLEPERFWLVAVNSIRSSVFALFFSVKCRRTLMEDVTGWHHLVGRTGRVMSNGAHSDNVDKTEFIHMKGGHLEEIAFCEKLGFTDKELKAFKSGKDVFFTSKRLAEMLAAQNGI